MKSKVLFVCMGNICRSPTAEGILRKMLKDANLDKEVVVDSAGTHAYHLGKSPDPRAVAAAGKRGYDLSTLVSRQVTVDDFRENDMILAMDWDNMTLLQQQCPRQYSHKIQLLMRYSTEHDEATVPDPYYGGPDGFDTVLNYIEDSCTGLIEVMRKRVLQFAAA
ncbi:MAG: low molecular weight phosphotyrosine protein phosphatase [Limnobacter sp.]|nr:low molecular weight phosphotyrosine protein phosphatase [Limnobacter sp.]